MEPNELKTQFRHARLILADLYRSKRIFLFLFLIWCVFTPIFLSLDVHFMGGYHHDVIIVILNIHDKLVLTDVTKVYRIN